MEELLLKKKPVAGDLLSGGSLVVKELTFKEWTQRIDESMVEYRLEEV